MIEALVGAGSGSAVMLIVARYYLGSLMTRLEKAEGKLKELEDSRIAGIEARMERFESGCNLKHDKLQETLTKVEHMAADLANMLGWTKKIDAKLDRIAEDAAGQRADLAGKDRWLQNLDDAHQAHVRDREVHRG